MKNTRKMYAEQQAPETAAKKKPMKLISNITAPAKAEAKPTTNMGNYIHNNISNIYNNKKSRKKLWAAVATPTTTVEKKKEYKRVFMNGQKP